jgi:hypothetical protein
MSWFTDLIDRIDARLDKPADQSVLENPRRRRSLRMIDSMKERDERVAKGEDPGEPTPVRGGAAEKNARQRWLGR